MYLYLIKQSVNEGYDTYDSAVVAALSEEDARNVHPSEYVTHISEGQWMGNYSGGPNIGGEYRTGDGEWVRYSDIASITVKLLGETTFTRGVILASFNAG